MTSTVATFKIEYTQYINEHGEAGFELPDFAQDVELLIKLYRHMVILRAYDAKAIALQRTGKMGTYASTLGQEAIGTAVGSAMQPEDVLVPFYRDYAAQLLRGVKMSEIYSYWGGDERGSNFENNKEDFPIAVPIASQCLHAAGIATAFKIRNEKRVAVASIGDGGTSEGDFYEAINVAGAWKLPVVFVVNNNKWAISVPLEKQTAAQTVAQKAIAAGIDGCQVDGNDVIATRDIMLKALNKARNGDGPTLVEAISYRLSDHTTADDASRYRSKDELNAAWQKEPLLRFKKFLENSGHWSEPEEVRLRRETALLVEQAVDEFMSRKPQTVESIFDFQYATLPHDLKEQRAQMLEDVKHG